MKIKKVLAMCLISAMVLGSFAGCGKDEGESTVSVNQEDPAWKEAMTTPYGKYPETVNYTLGKTVTNFDVLDGTKYEGDDDENNIMASLLAKRLGARRVLALINQRSYADLMHGTQIDIALTPSQAMLGELLAYVRKGDVQAVHSLRRGVAEALELVVRGDKKTSRVVGREVGSLRLPEDVQQHYFKASEDQIEVNQISPTGYPMRMLSNSPAIGDGIRPNCEAYGYLLDANGHCSYIEAYNREVAAHPGVKRLSVMDKTCLCTQMRNFDLWTCGHYTYRLKDTSRKQEDGTYQLLTAEHIFKDYQFSTEGHIALPE